MKVRLKYQLLRHSNSIKIVILIFSINLFYIYFTNKKSDQSKSDNSFKSSALSFDKPVLSFDKLESSFDKPEAAYDKPELSFNKPESSFKNPWSSYNKPNSSLDKHELSIDKPKASFDKPESSFDKPEISYDKPELSLNKPESSFKKPDSSYDKPESPFDKPELSLDKPASSFDKPESSFDKSKPSFDKPESSFDKPESSFDKPELPLDHQSVTATKNHSLSNVWEKKVLEDAGFWNYKNFSSSELNQLSTLGRRLFLHEDVGIPSQKKFVIYIYKLGTWLHKRLISRYTDQDFDPFEQCSVRNCKISYEQEDFDRADAVLFHLHLLPGPPTDLKRTNFDQRWVWMSDESIFNTFSIDNERDIDNYDNFFNWSMTYRTDSDVPVPYGRTIPLLNKPNVITPIDIFSKKTKTLAIMTSTCYTNNGRWKYVELLKKFVDVDTYGLCGKYKCEGHFRKDCPLLNSYKFYLAFENSNCKDYITEKAWWNAIEKEAVPVVMGTSKANYNKILPPFSFLHIDDFESPQMLAEYIKFLAENKDGYNLYHQWRSSYRAVNEHGYFQSNVMHYCRLCEALNYNDRSPKTYSSMEKFWNQERDCNKRNYFFEYSYYR